MVQTNVPVADVPLCSFNRAFTLHQVFAFDIMTVQTQLSAFSLLGRQVCLRGQYSYSLASCVLTVYHMAGLKVFS